MDTYFEIAPVSLQSRWGMFFFYINVLGITWILHMPKFTEPIFQTATSSGLLKVITWILYMQFKCIDWLIVLFCVLFENISLISGEMLQRLDLSTAFVAFTKEGSLSCHTCYDIGPRFTRCHRKELPHHLRKARGTGDLFKSNPIRLI